MQQAAYYYKYVKYRVHIAFSLAYTVKHCAYRVADTAEQQEDHAALAYRLYKNREHGSDYPAYRKIEYHGEHFVFLKVNCRKCNPERRQSPYNAKVYPA